MILILMLLSFFNSAHSWGPTGHRVVAKIAENHLSFQTKRKISKILLNEDLTMVANWMDFIRSNPNYNYTSPWHYISIEDDKTYETQVKSEKGDIVSAIETQIKVLKNKKSKNDEIVFALKVLVHLIGDLHQPLHVGRSADKGGNSIDIRWFGEATNLHRLWDEHLIEMQKLSYTEYAQSLEIFYKDESNQLFQGELLDWVKESKDYRSKLYQIPKAPMPYWEYKYNYDHIGYLNQRLYQAGRRLARLLNQYIK